jgi:5-methylthioadenosine/S-adenosylhomocysteine deaminase
MKQADLILSARWVFPIAPINHCLIDHSLVIKQDKIIDLGPTDKILNDYQTKQHQDLHQHALLPGLVNMHAHTPMNLFRGLADDLPLMDWLTQHIWPAEKALIGPESVRLGSELAMADMLRGGITCFNDHYFYPDITAAAAINAGMRAAVGMIILNVPTSWAQTEAGYFTRAKAMLEQRTDSPLITWLMCPHAPYTVSDESLIKLKQWANEYQLRIHMHVHETQAEIEQGLATYQSRPLARLDKLGLLDNHFIAVHMTQLLDEEIQRVADTGMHIVHCPESNLKLASGFAPIHRLMKAGVNVSIGTDSAASNNDLDLWGELQTAAMLAKAVSGDCTALNAYEALKMATLNGANALGLDKQIGSLEINKYADVIAVNLDHPFTQPLYDPASALVYALNRLQVSDVWVAGECLLKNGDYTRFDINNLLDQAKTWTEQARAFAHFSK